MTSVSVAAIDLGATSGRVVLGRIGPGELAIEDVARFPNGAATAPDGALRWDVSRLYRDALSGLRAAFGKDDRIRSVGIDSWAVDYGLLRGGTLLEEPYCYRDPRTARGVELVSERIGPAELYARNGLQFLPFNTLYQLAVDRADGRLERVERALLVPDLLAYWLTGRQVAEVTNASTTGLLDPRSTAPRWDEELMSTLGLLPELLAPLVAPGERIGRLTSEAALSVGAWPDVIAVGSHDTASAVVGVPATQTDFAYISSGTWSLVGVELPEPVFGEAGRLAGFTNEGGVDGRIRYLHNVMGLWLLSESLRTWEAGGEPQDLPALLAAAATVRRPVGVFDADDVSLLPPGGMPARIEALLRAADQPIPSSRPELVRSILESLAAAYARTVDRLRELTGQPISVVHIVGGGSLNELLCQLTADRTGLPVLAGPVEATAMGNLLVQARQSGVVGPTLEDLRSLVAEAHPPKRYEPRD